MTNDDQEPEEKAEAKGETPAPILSRRRIVGIVLFVVGVTVAGLVSMPLRTEMRLRGAEVAVMSGPVLENQRYGPVTRLRYRINIGDTWFESEIVYRNEPIGHFGETDLIGIRYVVGEPSISSPDFLRWYRNEMFGAEATGILMALAGAALVLSRARPKQPEAERGA